MTRSSLLRGLVGVALLGATAASLVISGAGPVLTVVVLFALVVPFEKLFPRHRQRLRRPLVLTDIAYAVAQPVLGAVGIAAAIVIGIASLAWLPGLALRPLVTALPGPVQMLAGIALFDLAIYFVHRWSHEVPFLWRFHAIHHSTEHLDWVSGFRGHPFDGAIVAPPFVLLLAAGFSPEFSGALAAIQIVTGLFLHANVRWRWRPLHKLVITPEFHHWHHANEPAAINTNYSVFLPLWDIVFRTYYMPADRRPQQYGVSEPIPRSIPAQLLHPFRGLPPVWWYARHPLLAARRIGASLRRGLRQLRRSSGVRRPMVAF
jgi:sterol desaturase/sphingolipid hydroxylase (fatty acid hydroxylase superfamily)